MAPADPEADARFLTRLAAMCDRFTPCVALDPPAGLTLDISGCAHLFGGEAALRAQACAKLSRLGLAVRASIAGTPDAAQALARFGQVEIALPGMDERLVRPLPVAALGVETGTVLALSRAGLKTLGDLADRSSTVLAARFGEALTQRLRRTLGREDARIVPLRPPPECVAERHFAEPLTRAENLEHALSSLLAEVARVLERRGAGGRAFEASFFRSDGAVRRIRVETGHPSRDPGAILRLYRERIDALADPIDPGFGFDAVRLGVPVVEPLDPIQADLDGRAAEHAAVADLVDRLVTRLGRDRVLRFAARDTHHPEREARLAPAASLAATATPAVLWPAPEPGEPPARPIHLFDPPQLIETLAEVPEGAPLRFRWRRVLHEVTRAEGPERISSEWWRDGPHEPTRDYYRIEDAEGRRFWVFRQGLYGRGTDAPRWFLHGLFA